jgi:type VI secretion system protein ImpK
MATATLDTRPPDLLRQPSRRGELALALQEAFTVVVRLRAGRQAAADALSFRAHIKQVLSAADQAARAVGYDTEAVKLAVYAYVALLDESVLNSAQPMFADWARQPLQEEVFGEHMAGENFFRTLHDLLGRQDSEQLADLLEVYQLCLLLGFHGRYGSRDAASVLSISNAVQAKIQRIRGTGAGLAPDWDLPAGETLAAVRDPMARRLSIIAAATAGVTLTLFLLYRLVLHFGIAELRALG